jgi:hypothetical protein
MATYIQIIPNMVKRKRDWFEIESLLSYTSIRFDLYKVKINDIVYTSRTAEFIDAYEKDLLIRILIGV